MQWTEERRTGATAEVSIKFVLCSRRSGGSQHQIQVVLWGGGAAEASTRIKFVLWEGLMQANNAISVKTAIITLVYNIKALKSLMKSKT